jgi:hypothetical protein
VKWWLLALPQYLVVAVFAGGAWPAGGLIGLLVLIAGVVLLFTAATRGASSTSTSG